MFKKLALLTAIVCIPYGAHAQSTDGQDPMRAACARLLDKGDFNNICANLANMAYTPPATAMPVYGALVVDSTGVSHPFYGTYERCLAVYGERRHTLEINGVKNTPLPEEICSPAR